MKKILSTKKLQPHQRDLLLGSGFNVVDYNAIHIEFLKLELPTTIKNAIFTSQKGVASLQNLVFNIQHCYCVGQKTASLLIKNGQNVIKIAQNGAELGNFITKNYKNETFYHFCSSIRRDEIPQRIHESKNTYIELKTYKNLPNYIKFEQKWDGILFFSPSGVQSFCKENTIENATAFCIGKTTAMEARNHTQNVIVAQATSVESVIAKAVKQLSI